MTSQLGLEAEKKTPFYAVGRHGFVPGRDWHMERFRRHFPPGLVPPCAERLRRLKAPCLVCWGAEISPGRMMRVVMGFMREEHDGDNN